MRFAAFAAAAIALALNVAATIQLFTPQTTFGYQLIYTEGFKVASIDPGTWAASAGIAPGDRLDFTRSAFHDRILGLFYQPAQPGESARFVVIHAGRPHPVLARATLLTSSESSSALFSPLASFLRLAGFGYIAIALVILLRRTNRMTFGLFLYLVSATDATTYRFPDAIFAFAQFGSDLLAIAGPIGLIVFAARFPDDRATGWRAWLDRCALPMGVLFAIPNLAWDVRSLVAGAAPSRWMAYGSIFGALALILAAVVTLIVAYAAAPREQRQRFQWAIAGVLFTVLSYVTAWARYWDAAYWLASSDAVVWVATILYACAPFALAYAVVRQRVFDISFVVSRTLVYTIMSATIFGLFALIEWLTGRLIERSGITVALVAFAAICVAFSLNAVHSRVEELVESTLFRRRRQAEQRLADVAAGLPAAQSEAAVEAALVDEPVDAYALASANLFRRLDDVFAHDGHALDRGIALQLHGRRGSLRLHDAEAVLAVPVFVRSQLEAIAVYGAHRNGEDIDPDEAASLEALGAAAGIAYDHLEAQRIERDVTRWQRVAQRQARELASLRERMALLREHLAGDDADGHGSV
jgi:hypothetical protein